MLEDDHEMYLILVHQLCLLLITIPSFTYETDDNELGSRQKLKTKTTDYQW